MRISVVLLFLLSLLFTGRLHAQKLWFTDTTNVWYVNSGFTIYGPPDITVDCKLVYRYSNHAEYSGVDYHVISKTTSCIQSNLPGPIGPLYWDDSALVREDTQAHKIFARVLKLHGTYTHDTSEVLLYDYNMQTGDTFISGSAANPVAYVVDSITTILINGNAHKAWHLGVINSMGVYRDYKVVEGVGTLYDPLFPYNTLMPEGGWALSCLYNKDVGVYPNNPPWYMDCSLAVHDVDVQTISVFPNPAKDLIVLTCGSVPGSDDVLCITDATGKSVFKTYLTATRNTVKINIEQWPAGVYFVALSSPGKEVSFAKLVVIH